MPKRIVFCADGTWNHPHQTEDGLPADTNVCKFYRALQRQAEQIKHYDDGVGVDGTFLGKLDGGAFGDGLFHKIKDGYTAIASDYEPGDKIYVIGFSRGAYTARSLAGMIAICGLPARDKFTDQTTHDAFAAYRMGTARQPALNALKANYDNTDVKIEMLGVWDTVGSLGIPGDLFDGLNTQQYGFLDTSLHPNVSSAFHAISIDEIRSEFLPTLWDPKIVPDQEMIQVWFSGVHGDVGGGYAETGLSDIALSWMMAKGAQKGLVFDPYAFDKYSKLDPKHALDTLHDSWSVLWGFPKNRSVAKGSQIANSVAIRVTNQNTYRPASLPTDYPDALDLYTQVEVISSP